MLSGTTTTTRIEDNYAVLGLAPGASEEIIQRRWQEIETAKIQDPLVLRFIREMSAISQGDVSYTQQRINEAKSGLDLLGMEDSKLSGIVEIELRSRIHYELVQQKIEPTESDIDKKVAKALKAEILKKRKECQDKKQQWLEALRFENDASPEAIKKVYRQLSLLYATDRSPNIDSQKQALVKEYLQAYEALKNYLKSKTEDAAVTLELIASHYYLLGLPNNAPLERVKEQYAKLVSLSENDWALLKAHHQFPVAKQAHEDILEHFEEQRRKESFEQHKETIQRNVGRLIKGGFLPSDFKIQDNYDENSQEVKALIEGLFSNTVLTSHLFNIEKDARASRKIGQVGLYERWLDKDVQRFYTSLPDDMKVIESVIKHGKADDELVLSVNAPTLLLLLLTTNGYSYKPGFPPHIELQVHDASVNCGVAALTSKCMYDLVRAYQHVQSGKPVSEARNLKLLSFEWMCQRIKAQPDAQARFNYMHQQLHYMSEVGLQDKSKDLKLTDDNLIRPIQTKIAELAGKEDADHKDKVSQLQACVDTVKVILSDDIQKKFIAHMSGAPQKAVEKTDKSSKNTSPSAYDKAYTFISMYKDAKEIKKHTNKVKDILTGILLWAVAPVSLPVAAVSSYLGYSGVWDKMVGNTSTERALKDARSNYKKALSAGGKACMFKPEVLKEIADENQENPAVVKVTKPQQQA